MRGQRTTGESRTLIYAVGYENRWKERKGREREREKRVELNEETRRTEEKKGEENYETIGEAEAAAFHVAWHRLPLKSLLLFVSSSKIMIVCPRDLLLGGSPDAGDVRVDVARVYVCVRKTPSRRAPRSFARPRVRSPGAAGRGGGTVGER